MPAGCLVVFLLHCKLVLLQSCIVLELFSDRGDKLNLSSCIFEPWLIGKLTRKNAGSLSRRSIASAAPLFCNFLFNNLWLRAIKEAVSFTIKIELRWVFVIGSIKCVRRVVERLHHHSAQRNLQ